MVGNWRNGLELIDVEVGANLVRYVHTKDVLHVYDETRARLGMHVRDPFDAYMKQAYGVEDRGAISKSLVSGLEASENRADHLDVVSQCLASYNARYV